MQQDEISLQTLTTNEAVHVGYSDNNIVIVDSIQQFAMVNDAHVSMGAIAICTSGRVQGKMNGQPIELRQNQVAVIPENVVITDLMTSPDFNIKAMFFTTRILQSFLREKMSVWNEVMYIQHMHVVTMEEKDIEYYTHFYEMLLLCIRQDEQTPYRTEVVQALLRAAFLALCGRMSQKGMLSALPPGKQSAGNLFQRFLHLLSSDMVKHRTVESFASELCISAKYLSAVCKKSSGKTAGQWITEHVMEEIRYQLCHTDHTLKQVSSMLGFPNTSFFGKYVKEHFGMTPLQLRQT